MAGTDMQQERRRFTRIEFDAETELVSGGQRWSVELFDISLHGLLIREPENFQAATGDRFDVIVHLNGSDIKLHLPVTLVRLSPPYLGMECGAIDLESLTHLRRLVELNIGDESLLERELESLVEQADSNH